MTTRLLKFILFSALFCSGSIVASGRDPIESGTFFKIRGSLNKSGNLFTSSQKGNVAFLGGSITEMDGWREMVCNYLAIRFPDVKMNILNAAIPSLGSLAHTFRFQQDIASKMIPDLLFVEAAVNDHYNGYSDTQQLRSMEGIVRQAKTLNPDMDIVFIYFADPDKNADYEKGITPNVILNHEKVAAHYQISSINLAQEVAERIKAGEFSWKEEMVDLHPSPFGQKLYFSSIKQFLEQLWTNDTDRFSKIGNVDHAALDKYAYMHGNYGSLSKARYRRGFTYDPSYTPMDGYKGRPGFIEVPMLVADSPGALLVYKFSGTAIGINIIAGSDAGIIEYSIDNKPYAKIDLFTQWSSHLHLPWYILLGDELSDRKHLLRIRVASEHNVRSKGTACRIVHFLTNRHKVK